MISRIIILLISTFFINAISAQSDSTGTKWSLNVELGYGLILESKGKPPELFCFEGCTPLESIGKFESKRVGVSMNRKDIDVFDFSIGLREFQFDRLYRDEYSGTLLGDEWTFRYLDLQVLCIRSLITSDRWIWSAYGGASYSFKFKEEVSYPISIKSAMILSLGFRMDYKLQNDNGLFARFGIDQSLGNNYEYAGSGNPIGTRTLDPIGTRKFTPLHIALGMKLRL